MCLNSYYIFKHISSKKQNKTKKMIKNDKKFQTILK